MTNISGLQAPLDLDQQFVGVEDAERVTRYYDEDGNVRGLVNLQSPRQTLQYDESGELIYAEFSLICPFHSHEVGEAIALWRMYSEENVERFDLGVFDAAWVLGVPADEIADRYYGEYINDETFAVHRAEDMGATNNDAEWPYTHIDWDAAADELMQEYSQSNGYYFRDH